MNENNKKNNEALEIDLKRLFFALWNKAWMLIVAAILGAVIALVYTLNFVTPVYQSSAMFYVNNSSLSLGDTSVSITSSDIVASKNLVNTYIVILKSRTCLNDVIDYANLEKDYGITYGALRSMISASNVNETEIFQVTVTNQDPELAHKIANAIAYKLPKQISTIVEGTSAKIVDTAVVASTPSSPNPSRNAVLGFLVGTLLAAALIVLRTIYDVTIRSEEDIEQCCDLPILASVPNMFARSKGGYYESAENTTKRKKRSKKSTSSKKVTLIGKGISFAASESYKMLRTKLQFSFVDQKCPVIAVSSALAGEGKSLSSSNLAYALTQLDKKVLLIDCDMRRPTISTKLPVRKEPGLSNYLTGQNGLDVSIQPCSVDDAATFDVIASGQTPPNPIELLSSHKMEQTLDELRMHYDYIILDLPPVGEVSDAMVAAKLTDGILLVVRQDYCNTVALTNAIQQFEFVDSRILGIVVNCGGENSARYQNRYKQRPYRRYQSRYYYAPVKRAKNSNEHKG